MEQSNYRLAGWLAVVQAILFPLSFGISIVEMLGAKEFFDIQKPVVGPSDLLMIVFTVLAVYTLLKFRTLLRERYQYHDLDLLILLAVCWAIAFQVVAYGLSLLLMIMWNEHRLLSSVIFLIFFACAIVTLGILNILIAVKLLKVKENFSEYIRGFAYVSMVAGICEVTILLSPLALLLIPISAIVLALIFLRDQHEVEFV